MYNYDKNDRKKKITVGKNNNEFPLDLDQSPLQTKKHGKKEVILRFEPRDFSNQSEDHKRQCEQLLKYGVKCHLFFQRKKFAQKQYMNCVICISDDSNDQLYLIDLSDNKVEIIDIFKIADIEAGKNWAISKQKHLKIVDDKDLWLSLFYEKTKLGVMLYFEKTEIRDMFWCGFQELVVQYKYKKMNKEEHSSYDDIIEELKNFDDQYQFTFKETKDYINRLQLKISFKYLEQIYLNQINQNDKQKKGKDIDILQIKIAKRQLEKLIKMLNTHPEIFSIFQQYNGPTVRDLDAYSMNIDQFKHFLKTEQFENWAQKELQTIFSFLSTEQFSDKLSFIGFCKLIFSKKNTLCDVNKSKRLQDMDQPITNYFINSSKNSYSANLDFGAYYHFDKDGDEDWENRFKHIFFLVQNGVRYMDIEIWDGDKITGPVIQYGHTMTSKVPLDEVLQKLMNHVFTNNPYPFWLSIESHCSNDQIEMAKTTIKEILGKSLFLLPANYKEIRKYPSPNQLKHKIIVTGRIAQWLLDEIAEIDINNQVLGNIETELNEIYKQDQALAKEKRNNMGIFVNQKSNSARPKLKSYLEIKHNNDKSQQDLEEEETYKNGYNKQKQQEQDEDDDEDEDEDAKEQEKKNQKNSDISNSKNDKQNNKNNSNNNYNYRDSRSQNRNGSINNSGRQSTSTNKRQSGKADKNENSGPNTAVRDLSAYQSIQGIHTTFGMYTHTIKQKQDPSLWEIYDYSLQDLVEYIQADYNSAKDPVKPKNLLNETVARNHKDVISFCKQFLVKVIPVGKKIDSLNFNPMFGFKIGSQFIINHPQTFDISSLIYHSKFQENNNCGYVLKPPEQRETTNQIQHRSQKITVNLKVISGYQLRTIKGESVHPFIELLVVKPNEKDYPQFQTRPQEENNFCPIWKSNNQWRFTVEQPEISFLVFQAISANEQKILLGWYAMPCNAIRQGYRVIPLKDEHFCTIKNSYILVHSEVSPRQI